MRCFIGIPLPDHVRKALVRAEDCFKRVDARMNVVSEDNIHVTLNFLGEVDNVAKIQELLGNVGFKQFKASVKDISFFPKSGYIRVIHSPVNQGKELVIDLQSKITEALSLEKDDRFTPHATLARVKFVKSTNTLARACNDVHFEEFFDVDCFNLYSSKLTPNGPVYQILASYQPKV